MMKKLLMLLTVIVAVNILSFSILKTNAANTDKITDTVETPEQISNEFTTCPADEKLKEGKRNTEIMLVTVLIGLAGLVTTGYALQGSKKKKSTKTVIKSEKTNKGKTDKPAKASRKAKMTIFFSIFSIATVLATRPAYAICPVCTVAVGAGLGFSRYLGIDDVITSLWIGGIIVSTIFWTIDWLSKKNKNGLWIDITTAILMYVFVIIPLYWSKMIGQELNKQWGIDKILLGTIIGSVAFYFGARLHFIIKLKNKDRVLFPFQKVVIPVGSLWIMSLIFYFLIYY